MIKGDSTDDENRRPVTIVNPPTTRRNYAVFSCNTPELGTDKTNRYNYVFYLPLTVKAWRRIGHSSIVLIIGSLSEWRERPVLQYVLKELVSLNATIVFIPCSDKNSVLVATVSRLFAVSLLDWESYPIQHNSSNINQMASTHLTATKLLKVNPAAASKFNINPLDATNLLTTDADLWPLTANHFHLPRGRHRAVMSTNYGCCGKFSFKGQIYDMIPMSSVVMSVNTWSQVGLSLHC